MKRFVEIEYHDYMDMYPTTKARVFEGDDEESLEKNVNDFVDYMNRQCSGTTRLLGIMNQQEALMYLDRQVSKEHCNWREDSEEFIKNICKLYKECYGEDAMEYVTELLHQLDMADDFASREY